ncbi:Uncharacterised protein [uncultured Clostridium sp.]|nr:Uncharacterised protein [uncultured Clostridium sp.]
MADPPASSRQNANRRRDIQHQHPGQDPHEQMSRRPRDHPEYPNKNRCAPAHRNGSQSSPENGHRQTDISVKIACNPGVIPPPLVVHFLDHMTCDPLGQCRKDHTAKKQPDSMQLPAYDQQRCSRNTIDHTERPVHKSSVYESPASHCRHCSLKDPAEKAERKEQPQALKSCISHILYLSSPVFSFCFFFLFSRKHRLIYASVPRNTVFRFFIPRFHINFFIFHPASIKKQNMYPDILPHFSII